MAKRTAQQPERIGATLDRLPPNNLEAERGVIGAILLDPRLCDDVAIVLRPDDFYLDQHRRVYRRLLEMNAASSGIDLTLLVEELRSSGELVEIGGEAYLAELMNSVQVTAHAAYYAKIVQQNAIRRQLIETCESVLSDAYAPEVQPKELVARAEEKIVAINDQRSGGKLLSMHDIMPDVFRLVDADGRRSRRRLDEFIDLDNMLGGLHGSELIIWRRALDGQDGAGRISPTMSP